MGESTQIETNACPISLGFPISRYLRHQAINNPVLRYGKAPWDQEVTTITPTKRECQVDSRKQGIGAFDIDLTFH